MLETTVRLLDVLARLQSGGAVSGPELADRLGVTVRTVRRDIERLRQLGYAVESDVGVRGGYRLGEGGTAVPPLLLDEDETFALAVCVRAAAGDSVAGIADAAASALAKLEHALPARTRARVQTLAASIVRVPSSGGEVDGAVLLAVSTAAREHRRITAAYRDGGGRSTQRRLEPHRVVNVGRRWYLVAFDLDRGEWRTFRMDRMYDVAVTGHGATFVDPPDASEFVRAAITTAPYRHRAVADLDAPIDDVAARVPPTVATLEAVDARTTRLTTGADDLDALVVHLGTLGVSFRIVEPDALRSRLAEIAARLTDAAAAPDDDQREHTRRRGRLRSH